MSPDLKPDTKDKPNAYVIVNSEVFPVRDDLTNIGRKLDNHIVINDPRVSRNHAQIRVMDGQYIIFDLNSTGGTTVNGKRVNKSILYSGDAVTLAGVEIKFVQDVPRMISKSLERTGPLHDPNSVEIPTHIVPRGTLKKKGE